MHEERLLRIGREISLAALGMDLGKTDAWVIDRMTSILEEQSFHPGQTLYKAGEPAEYLYYMAAGDVRFTRDGGPSWTLRGRWFLGSFCALADRPATHTATATRDFYGMRVPAVAWVEMLEDSFPLARSAVVNMARALMRLEESLPAEPPTFARASSPLWRVPRGKWTLVERLALLVEIPMLRAAGVQALADLAADSKEVRFAVGELVVAEGVGHDGLIRIVDGEVLAEREQPPIVRHYGPGQVVCGAAIVSGMAAGWQARATTPVRAISVPIESLFDLMEEHFDLVRSILSAADARRQVLLEHLAAASSDLILT